MILTAFGDAGIYPALVYQKISLTAVVRTLMVFRRVGVATSFSLPPCQNANSREVMQDWKDTSLNNRPNRVMAPASRWGQSSESFSKKESRVESDL